MGRKSRITITKDSQLHRLHTTKVGSILMKGMIREQKVGWRLSRRKLPGKILRGVSLDEVEARTLTFHHDLPRASSHTNDNHCMTRFQDRLLARSTCTEETMNTSVKQTVNLNVVNVVPSAPGHSQKRELSPGSASCYYKNHRLKYVKSASCVQPVTNIKNAASNLPVGARLQNFWQTWLDLGAGPKVVQNPERGLHPPLPDPAETHKVFHCHKLLCQSPQEQLPAGGITSAYRQTCGKTKLLSSLSTDYFWSQRPTTNGDLH